MKKRTGLLFSSAVVLGLLGGTGAGFAIQQARPATPLPPLAAALPAGAAVRADDPGSASDDAAKLDGDLRKVLIDKPADAKDPVFVPARDWMTLHELSEYMYDEAGTFSRLNSDKFRRAARAAWISADGEDVEVDLVQFRTTDGANDFFTLEKGFNYGATMSVDSTQSGFVAALTHAETDGSYNGYGFVLHGTVVVVVYVTDPHKQVTDATVMKYTKDQADRL